MQDHSEDFGHKYNKEIFFIDQPSSALSQNLQRVALKVVLLKNMKVSADKNSTGSCTVTKRMSV
jgi:hypothetical protein